MNANMKSNMKSISHLSYKHAACALAIFLSASSAFSAAVDPRLSPQKQTTGAGQTLPQLAHGTLTSMKQVPYTDQGGETWVQVDGTGNCTFSIEGGGVPAVNAAASAAKPFPLKVKIPGAPTGSHLWTAKGTGTCTGTATATFTVQP